MMHTCVIPRVDPKIVVRRKIFLSGTFFRSELYNATPTKDATEVTSLTRPRNSGVNRSLFVLNPSMDAKGQHKKFSSQNINKELNMQTT